ncbi:MAG TPA: hypothetical protein VFO86_11610, partial [Terriglobia bacterium]|nr:hypothetical protein [Terriglobia bacterium]
MLQFLPTGNVTSNDRGEYRQFGLPPGQYFVLVSPSQGIGNQGEGIGSIPTFYPGARVLERATAVTVGRGQEVDHVDITLLSAPRNSVTVNLVLPPGVRTVTGKLQLIPESIDSSGGDMSGCIIWTCVTASRDKQIIYNVPLGRYTIIATANDASGGREYAGQAVIDIGDGQSGPITIRSSAVESTDISGHVRFADTGEEVKVATATIDLQSSTRRYPASRIASEDDLTLGFTIKHVVLGEYKIGAYTPPGTYLADVLQSNRSVLNGLLKVSEESHGPIDVLLGRDGGIVRGIVRNIRGTPVGFADAVLVPLAQSR